MVTTFNKKDLISFGKYLLSEGREKSLKQTGIEQPDALPYEERKRDVYDADLANWLRDRGKTQPLDVTTQEITVANKDGSTYKTTSYAQFNNGYSYIIIDDGCYQIVNGNAVSSWIFREAIAVIKDLPENPKDLLHLTREESE